MRNLAWFTARQQPCVAHVRLYVGQIASRFAETMLNIIDSCPAVRARGNARRRLPKKKQFLSPVGEMTHARSKQAGETCPSGWTKTRNSTRHNPYLAIKKYQIKNRFIQWSVLDEKVQLGLSYLSLHLHGLPYKNLSQTALLCTQVFNFGSLVQRQMLSLHDAQAERWAAFVSPGTNRNTHTILVLC